MKTRIYHIAGIGLLTTLVGCAGGARQDTSVGGEAGVYQPQPNSYPSDQGGYQSPSSGGGDTYSGGGYSGGASTYSGGGYDSQAHYPAAPAPAGCYDCGVVTDIQIVKEEGKGTGIGAIAGAVGGGLLGGEFGHGTGRKIATIAGVAGGAYAGHQVEKKLAKGEAFLIFVRMDSGRVNTYKQLEQPQYGVGSQVRVVNGRVLPR